LADVATMPADSSAPLDLAALCPHCLTENNPAAYFCRNCQTPMRTISEIDPIARIYAMGDTYRKAAEGEPSTLALLGMIAICVPAILTCLAGFFSMWNAEILTQPIGLLFTLGYGVGGTAIFGALLYKTARNYFKHRPAEPQDNSPADGVEPGDVTDDSPDSGDAPTP
jgi:hypothetical protein